MIGATQLRFVVLLCGLLMNFLAAVGDEPKSPASKSIAECNAMKLPTKIAGAYPPSCSSPCWKYHGGES